MKNVKERDEESQTEVIEGLTYQDLLNNVEGEKYSKRLNTEFVEKHLGDKSGIYETFIGEYDPFGHEDTDHLRVFMSVLQGELTFIQGRLEYLNELYRQNLIELIQENDGISMYSFEELS